VRSRAQNSDPKFSNWQVAIQFISATHSPPPNLIFVKMTKTKQLDLKEEKIFILFLFLWLSSLQKAHPLSQEESLSKS